MELYQARPIFEYKLGKTTAIKLEEPKVWAINLNRVPAITIVKVAKRKLLKPFATYLQLFHTPTVLKLQFVKIRAPRNQIRHHLVRQVNLIEIHGAERGKTHGGHTCRQGEINSRELQDSHSPTSEHTEREIILVIERFIGLVIVSVDEEVEVELTRLEVPDGAAHPGVDVEAEAVVVDEREGEEFDRSVGPENESAVHELGEEVAVIGRRVV